MSMITRVCEHPECVTQFEAREADVKRGMNRYCSRACSHSRPREKKHHEPNTECGWCRAPLYRPPGRLTKSGQFFCSTGHKNLAAAHGTLKTGPQPAERLTCGCGRRILSKRGVTHCARCWPAERIRRWLAGDMEVTYVGAGKEPATWVKSYLVETRGDRCERCGFDEKTSDGRSIIQMDHVDGRHLDNSPDNLKLLCPNCHAMTETFGSKNKAGTRRYRRGFAYEDR